MTAHRARNLLPKPQESQGPPTSKFRSQVTDGRLDLGDTRGETKIFPIENALPTASRGIPPKDAEIRTLASMTILTIHGFSDGLHCWTLPLWTLRPP